MSYVIAWSKAFGLTVGVEVVVAALLLRGNVHPASGSREHGAETGRARAHPSESDTADGVSLPLLCALIFYANLASHPAVWFIFPRLDLAYSELVVVAETWAVVSEAIFYFLVFRRVELARAAGISLIANACSFGLGLLLRSLTGWV